MGSALDFKGEAGNSQIDEKEQTFGEEILAGTPRNDRTQRGV